MMNVTRAYYKTRIEDSFCEESILKPGRVSDALLAHPINKESGPRRWGINLYVKKEFLDVVRMLQEEERGLFLRLEMDGHMWLTTTRPVGPTFDVSENADKPLQFVIPDECFDDTYGPPLTMRDMW